MSDATPCLSLSLGGPPAPSYTRHWAESETILQNKPLDGQIHTSEAVLKNKALDGVFHPLEAVLKSKALDGMFTLAIQTCEQVSTQAL